jgi:hypothetical protein
MALRFDLSGQPLPPLFPDRLSKNIKNQSVTVRTRTVSEPSDGGTNGVTREEYEALLKRVETLETALRNAETVTVSVTGNGNTGNAGNDVTKTRGNGNALSAAEKMRRYRERKKASDV